MTNKSNVPTAKENMESLSLLLHERRDKLQEYLPPDVSVDDFKASIQLAFIHNPDLHRCSAASKMQALYDCAYAGLDIAGKQPHGYLVPRGTTCCFDVSYHGYMHLGLRSGAIKSCRVGTVKAGDNVEYYRDEDGDHFRHSPNLLENGDPTHYYAVFKLADSSTLVSIMTHAEVEQHRDQFAMTSGSKTPWQTSFEAMAHKTVLRRPFLRGLIQIRDATVRRIIESDQAVDGEVISGSEPSSEVQEELRQFEQGLFEKHEQVS